MSERLPLNIFIDSSTLYNSVKIPQDSFSLLGANLNRWLVDLLKSLGVLNQPVIHGNVDPRAVVSGQVFIEKGAKVGPFAVIQGPCFIGKNSDIRHCAYLRGDVYIGESCVVGHTTEVKSSCFFDHAKASHFAYIGNSILGQSSNLGAGTKLANLKLNSSDVSYRHPISDSVVSSGLKKFGSILGDFCQTGCNSVLSPGSLLLPKTSVMPCLHYRGTLKKGIAR
ncbi:MAG: glucose-1-phosphate thymidylyltransferase [Zetaproteobacteria bacterium]|nr:glucose-1-phosphate thymidylyltransferase [Pseudobdellovibrionaceae bacterium]|tara:strand:- start:34 stop:705 length:672 start_codon:yes stop_codon:yes gene_type:complete